MSYHVEFSLQTIEALKRMDQHTAKILLRWIENFLEDCDNPRRRGNGSSGKQSAVWRYSIGQNRLMAEIEDDRKAVVLIWLGRPYPSNADILP